MDPAAFDSAASVAVPPTPPTPYTSQLQLQQQQQPKTSNTNASTAAAASATAAGGMKDPTSVSVGTWESLPSRRLMDTPPGVPQQFDAPAPRAMHTMVSWGDSVFIFGGFDGVRRLGEFYEYSFQTKCWFPVKSRGIPPAPRDRHAATVAGNSMYIFGGHDGAQRLGDTHVFDFVASRWLTVSASHGPTARHSHTLASHKNAQGERLYLFGGFDGAYRNDVHTMDLSSHEWSKVVTTGNGPTPRYRSSLVSCCDVLVVFGGHDGTRHLNDLYAFKPETGVWSRIYATGLTPIPRDSHTAVTYNDSMIIFGGSSGSAMNDLHELVFSTSKEGGVTVSSSSALLGALESTSAAAAASSSSGTSATPPPSLAGAASDGTASPLTTTTTTTTTTALMNGGAATTSANGTASSIKITQSTWVPLFPGGTTPHPRFCHAACVCGPSRVVVFGGFDGITRSNDLFQLNLNVGRLGVRVDVPASTLVRDFGAFVNNADFADVAFAVQGRRVPAHKMVLVRFPHFAKLLGYDPHRGSPGDGGPKEIEVKDVDYDTFLTLLTYVYTDECDFAGNSVSVVSLFQAADKFGLERLKCMCQNAMLDVLDASNAASLFARADEFNAAHMRALAFNYIIAHFDEVSVTQDFEQMGRTRVDLVFEILKRRGAMKIKA